jgi:hypothetical protein
MPSKDQEKLKWYICRACGLTFAFKYDVEQHGMQTGHREFIEKDIDSNRQ